MRKMNNSSDGDFFETCWANKSDGFEGLETFFWKMHLVSSLSLFIFSWSSPTSSLVSSFISDLLFFFSGLFSSLLFHLLVSSLLLSRLLFCCLVLSFHVLSCLSFSVSLGLSLFLSSFSVSLSVSVCHCLCVCGVVCCGVVWCVWCVVCVVWCVARLGTQKKPPCVDSKRPRVYRHHAHMCYHMCAWCRYTRRRFESTHGSFLDGHTEGRGSSLVLPKFAHVWLSRDSEVHHKKPVDLHQFQFENKSREQRVADSSKHSLCLVELLRDTAEGSTHNTHQHTHTHQHIVTHRPTHHHPLPSLPSLSHTQTHMYMYMNTYTYTYKCMCMCMCMCLKV